MIRHRRRIIVNTTLFLLFMTGGAGVFNQVYHGPGKLTTWLYRISILGFMLLQWFFNGEIEAARIREAEATADLMRETHKLAEENQDLRRLLGSASASATPHARDGK
jgi:hypothetical protein